MKTDDRLTRQRRQAEGNEATVVRLSDWLAADDELVPIGPRAHADTATPASATESDPGSPAGSGFWDGDTSVHTAVPGPGIFDEPGQLSAERARYRGLAPIRRPRLPALRPFGWFADARDAFTGLLDRVSLPWTAGGLALVALVTVVLAATLSGSSSGHREAVAQAAIGDQPRATLSGTLGEIGTGGHLAAVTQLRSLPRVDTASRTFGAGARRAQALSARDRHHAVDVSASRSEADTSTASSVDTPATPAPAPTSPAPTETEPVQTTPTSGGGDSSSSGGSTSSSPKGAFGAAGPLGPGSSPSG